MPRTTCEIAILEDIHPFGFSAAAFAAALKGEGDRVEVLINSPGGDIMEGLGICGMLRAERRPVRAVVLGCAASMASVIAAAAPETVMWDSAFMMLHNPSSFVDVFMRGEAEDLRDAAGELVKQADVLDFLKARLVSLYQRGGKAKADLDWDKILNEETWLSAAQCLEMGLVDRVVPAPKEAQAHLGARWSAAASARVRPPGGRVVARGPSAPPSPGSSKETTYMPDVKRVSAILVAVSGLLALAQEGQGAEDAQEKELCTSLSSAIAPVASAFQALLPQAEQPVARFQDLLALRDTVIEVTGERAGLAGAVRALHRNAQAAALLGERAQVTALVDQMIRDGQIGPEEKAHYTGYTIADAQAAQRLLRKAPLREQAVASDAVDPADRPPLAKKEEEQRREAARAKAFDLIGREAPKAPSNGAQTR